MRVRTPWPAGGNHQCWKSPSTNCRAVAREIDRRLQGGAWIEAGADALGQRDGGAERGGIVDGAIAPDELAAVGRPCGLPAAKVGKSHAPTMMHVPGIAREDSAAR